MRAASEVVGNGESNGEQVSYGSYTDEETRWSHQAPTEKDAWVPSLSAAVKKLVFWSSCFAAEERV